MTKHSDATRNRPAVKHLVIHQHRRANSLGVHECHMVYALREIAGTCPIISRIITGSTPSVHYGSDHPMIRRRVDRLRLRIQRGQHFAAGDVLAGTPRIGPGAVDRLKADLLPIVGELYFALAPEPRFKVILPSTSGGEANVRWESIPGTNSRWADYLAAHREHSPAERERRLRELSADLVPFCQAVLPAAGPTRRLPELFYPVFCSRRRTRAQGERAYYTSAKSLAINLGAEVLEVNPRTLLRRVSLESPFRYGYG